MVGWKGVRREPYRLFFPLGVFFGIAGAGHWFLYGVAAIPAYSGFYHASVQVWLFMTCFVVGFLGTAVPSFTGAPPAGNIQIFSWLTGFFIIFSALLRHQWVFAESALIFLQCVTIVFLGRCFLKRKYSRPPVGFIWMPVAMLHFILGTLLLMLGQMEVIGVRWQTCGRMMEEQGFLMSLVLGVGSFLGPRLLGEKARLTEQHLSWCHAAAIPLFFFSFFWEGGPHERWAYLIRGTVCFLIFYFSGMLRFTAPKSGSLFSKFLETAFWMFPASFFLIASNLALKTLFFHVLFIGGFAYLTFLIATMVVLSHAGEAEKLRNQRLWILPWITTLTFLSLGVRLSAPLWGSAYFIALASAASIWMLIGGGWLIFAAHYLLKLPVSDAVEKLHEKLLQKKEGHVC